MIIQILFWKIPITKMGSRLPGNDKKSPRTSFEDSVMESVQKSQRKLLPQSSSALSQSSMQSPAKKSAWSTKENANVDSQPESRPRSRNSACKPPANHIIPNAPIIEHVLVQKEAMQYLSDDFLDCKYFCVEVWEQFEIIVDILHSLMQDGQVQRNPPAQPAWLKSITAVPAEKLPLQMLCFLYCSLCTTDEKLVAHCATFVNQNNLLWNIWWLSWNKEL